MLIAVMSSSPRVARSLSVWMSCRMCSKAKAVGRNQPVGQPVKHERIVRVGRVAERQGVLRHARRLTRTPRRCHEEKRRRNSPFDGHHGLRRSGTGPRRHLQHLPAVGDAATPLDHHPHHPLEHRLQVGETAR